MSLPLKDALVRWAGERGYRIAWGGPAVLDGIRREIEDRRLTLGRAPERFSAEETEAILAGAGGEAIGAGGGPSSSPSAWPATKLRSAGT